MRSKIITICSVALLSLGACSEDNNTANNGTNGSTNGTTAKTNNGTTNNGTSTGTTTSGSNNNTTNNGTTGGTTAGTTAGPTDSAMCVQYCADALANCTAANELYSSEEMCLTTCAGLTDNGTDCSADPASCEQSNDSVQCRLYHLSVAAGTPDDHCGHAALASAGDVCN